MEVPTREIYWSIAGHLIMYLFVAVGAAAFIYGLWRHWRAWSLGRPEVRWDRFGERLKSFLSNTLLHTSVLKEAYPGVMHFFIFWGFAVLAVGTAVVLLQADLGLKVLYGTFYLWLSLALDLFGLLAVVGLLIAVFRRYIQRPARLDSKADDALVLTALLVILVTGFFIEGLRMATAGDQWALWSPVGLALARMVGAGFDGAAVSPVAAGLEALKGWYAFLWWGHMLLAVGFVAYMPYSKLFHVLASPANQFMKSLGPKGALATVDIENSETFGASRPDELTWKQLFDTDACTRCGRCQDQCPAFAVGKALTPKGVIQDLKSYLERYGPALADVKAKVGRKLAEEAKAEGKEPDAAREFEAMEEAVMDAEIPALFEEAMPEENLWNCTTCRSCEEQCPVFVEVIPKVVELRRYLVLMESRMPTEAGRTLRNLQNNGNPWGLGRTQRADWLENVEGVKKLSEGDEVEYLFWVGCFGAFDDRSRAITQATIKIFQAAGLDFGVIGEGETCCGDSARRLGNEYLYQTLAMENIEALSGVKFDKIVTACPHCLNALKNEYPQLGGNYEVVHHSEVIAELLAEGKLELTRSLSGEAARVTYHDPCYLGRYNDVFDAPRKALAAAGADVVEMVRSKKTSFCCGAGGGRMWLEEEAAHKVNARRAEQALEVKPETIVTGCPYCLQMFDDGLKAVGEERDITKDLAEIVAKAL